jgi:hypothetical protein
VLFRSSALLAGVTFLAGLARAGQVHQESVTFSELVAEASVILLVKPARKPRSQHSVDITPPGKAADPRRYPPFQFVIHEYEVVKVLKNEGGQRLGKRLRVHPADHDMQLSVHRDYHVRGISKHWISRGYEPKQPPTGTSTENIVVFLRGDAKKWSFAAEGAVESSALTEEITAELARQKTK